MTTLEAKDITHTFIQGKTRLQVLDNLNFSVDKGEFVAFAWTFRMW